MRENEGKNEGKNEIMKENCFKRKLWNVKERKW